jgi:flagellar basal body-associated protein FliL
LVQEYKKEKARDDIIIIIIIIIIMQFILKYTIIQKAVSHN